ncbi:MAG: EthD family reductase [Rhodococcus sp. (in: high G+C Gram-positive bacteria)]
MSFRVAVCYSQPEDTAAFDKHYTEVHAPLARVIPGLTDFTFGKAKSTDGSEPPYYAIASLYFPDEATMKSGLSSPEMGAAAADLSNFASGGVTLFTHEERSVLQP